MLKPIVRKINSKNGFTLVEILVGFAIFMVLCAGIVGIITMSSTSYRRTSAMVNMQIESQITMTMLSEYIIDTNDAIIYFSSHNELHLISGSVTNVFRFAPQENSLFLDDELVSRNVSGFSADFINDRLVSVEMSFTSLNRTYTACQLTALRNSPLLMLN
jgi:type II secretory pathway pseudopilin PulG